MRRSPITHRPLVLGVVLSMCGWIVAQPISERCAGVEKRRIVVSIGIGNYPNWERLHAPVKDADDIEDVLEKKYGYISFCSAPGVKCPVHGPEATGAAGKSAGGRPLRDENATKKDIEGVVDLVRRYVCPKDDLVFFYSGHGDYRPDEAEPNVAAKGKGFLIPYDAPAHDQEEWSELVPLGDLLDNLSSLRAQNILVILDACHSGIAIGDSLTNPKDAEPEFKNDQLYMEAMATKKSRLVITAAGPDQTASDCGPGVIRPGNSLFTGILIDQLETQHAARGKSYIDGLGLSDVLKTEVTAASAKRQTPDSGRFKFDENGELILPLDMGFEALCASAHAALRDGEMEAFTAKVKQAAGRKPEDPKSLLLRFRLAVENSKPDEALALAKSMAALQGADLPLAAKDLTRIQRQLQFWEGALALPPTPRSQTRVKAGVFTGSDEDHLEAIAGDRAFAVPVSKDSNLYFRFNNWVEPTYVYAFMVDDKGVINPAPQILSPTKSTKDSKQTMALDGPDAGCLQVWHFIYSDHPITEYEDPPPLTRGGAVPKVDPGELAGIQHVVVRIKADGANAEQ